MHKCVNLEWLKCWNSSTEIDISSLGDTVKLQTVVLKPSCYTPFMHVFTSLIQKCFKLIRNCVRRKHKTRTRFFPTLYNWIPLLGNQITWYFHVFYYVDCLHKPDKRRSKIFWIFLFKLRFSYNQESNNQKVL